MPLPFTVQSSTQRDDKFLDLFAEISDHFGIVIRAQHSHITQFDEVFVAQIRRHFMPRLDRIVINFLNLRRIIGKKLPFQFRCCLTYRAVGVGFERVKRRKIIDFPFVLNFCRRFSAWRIRLPICFLLAYWSKSQARRS